MKISELQDIAEKLLDAYGSGRHWEITNADKTGDGWRLDIKQFTENEKNEGTENADNK